MKLVTLLLYLSLTTGHALPGTRSLVTRDDQDKKNLDNDPDYTDPETGSITPKSRILTGLGPDAAIDRWFDWDESCTDKDHRAKIVTTFRNVITLITGTSDQLRILLETLNPGGSLNKQNQKYIFDHDPAFAQMFGGQDHRIGYVKETFDFVLKNARIAAGERGGAKPGALRFICNADDHVRNGARTGPYCGTGDEAAQASTFLPLTASAELDLEPRYTFETSSSITFCPIFFDNNAFPNIHTVIKSGDYTLDKIDCAERVLLHEYMHLPWIRNMVPQGGDFTGYENAAEVGKNGWYQSKNMPDNYAWYALYSYFNLRQGGCGDVWPKDPNGDFKPPKPNEKPS